MSTTLSLDDTWTSAATSGHGRALRVRMRPPSADWMRRATTRVDVSWRVSWRDRLFHGGPSLATDARMIALERGIATRVESTGAARLQIVETVDCVRTWSFYTTEPADIVDLIETIVNASDVPKLAVTMVSDPDWTADRTAREALVIPKTILSPAPRPVSDRKSSLTDIAVHATTM